jgi:adenosylcobinamide-GDP ribazoletransferase
MKDGVKLAVGTLSVLPVGVPSKVDRTVAGQAMVLAPAVGVVLGGISAAVVAGVDALRPDAPLLSAVLGIVVLVALSGALHLDGLADFADGLGSRRDRETMLRIMKQSDIGPFGVASIAGVLLIDVAALAACVQAGFGWQALLIATVASRLTLPWSCRTKIPAARPDGLGTMVASTVRPLTAALLTLLTTALAPLLLWLTARSATVEDWLSKFPTESGVIRLYGQAWGNTPSGWSERVDLQTVVGAGAAVLLAVTVGLLVVRRARKALGGITGDVLGAAVELALPTALLTLALST